MSELQNLLKGLMQSADLLLIKYKIICAKLEVPQVITIKSHLKLLKEAYEEVLGWLKIAFADLADDTIEVDEKILNFKENLISIQKAMDEVDNLNQLRPILENQEKDDEDDEN